MVAIVTKDHIFPVLTVTTFAAKGWIGTIVPTDIDIFVLDRETARGNVFRLFLNSATVATLELNVS